MQNPLLWKGMFMNLKKNLLIFSIVFTMFISLTVSAFAAGADDVWAALDNLAEKVPEMTKLVDDARNWMSKPDNRKQLEEPGVADKVINEINAIIAEMTGGSVQPQNPPASLEDTSVSAPENANENPGNPGANINTPDNIGDNNQGLPQSFSQRFSDLDQTQKAKVVTHVANAANTIGLKIGVNIADNQISLMDSQNNVIANYTTPIKQTGLAFIDMSGFVVAGTILAAVIIIFITFVIIYNRYRLSNCEIRNCNEQ